MLHAGILAQASLGSPEGDTGGHKLMELMAVCHGWRAARGSILLYHVPHDAGCSACVQLNPLKMPPWSLPLEFLSFHLFPDRCLAQRKEERWGEAGMVARRGLCGDCLQSFPPAPAEIDPRACLSISASFPPRQRPRGPESTANAMRTEVKLGFLRVAGPLTAPPSFPSSSRCAGGLTSAQPDRKGNFADREKSYFLLSFLSSFSPLSF